ncbi:MAG TPA: carboxypeptidase regulatory-like domain-containing protein [Flavipsychrobacter sp.]|nr:carboxypeptidase regulatory-like domain-containing protein [Flavipsychrobacter sp.]
MKQFFFSLLLFTPTLVNSQTITPNDGNWSLKTITLANTPEADLMVRTGDIDNLGFGWPTGFNPFSGSNTPAHGYPWTADPSDPPGTDRIMVISSYNGTSPYRDGYTSNTNRPDNIVHPISLSFTPPATINSAQLQIFVDDFQASVWGASYQVFLDGLRSNGMENIINSLVQTGPIGKMITYNIPSNMLPQLQDGALSILFDDSTSGVGDGYGIDFVKLLINPYNTASTNTYLHGTITDASSSSPIAGVVVSASNSSVTATTDAAGHYLIPNVAPGIVQLTTYKPGYGQANSIVSLQTGDSTGVNFQLLSPAPLLIYSSPFVNETNVDTQRIIKLFFDQPMDTGTFNLAYFTLSDTLKNITGSFSSSNDTLIFTPNHALNPQTDYTILIYHNLKSINGVSLAQDIQIPFSTYSPMSVAERLPMLVNIYPNPAKDVLVCKSYKKLESATISISDLAGKTLLEVDNVSVKEIRLDVHHLSSGLYILKMNDGHQQSVQKFLKQ